MQRLDLPPRRAFALLTRKPIAPDDAPGQVTLPALPVGFACDAGRTFGTRAPRPVARPSPVAYGGTSSPRNPKWLRMTVRSITSWDSRNRFFSQRRVESLGGQGTGSNLSPS